MLRLLVLSGLGLVSSVVQTPDHDAKIFESLERYDAIPH